jgi:hypothetical protein
MARVEATTARVELLAGEDDEEPLQQDDAPEVNREQRGGQ